MVDGVMYQTASWSVVPPSTPGQANGSGNSTPGHREKGSKGCCDASIAASPSTRASYVAAYDGRLAPLSGDGAKVWEKDTVIDPSIVHHHRRAARRQRQGHDRQGGAEYGIRGYSRPTMPRPATRRGVFTPCPAIPRSRSKRVDRFRREELGSGGKMVDHGGGGTPWDSWPTILNSTGCTSAPATVRPGTTTSEAPRAATICICLRSWRSNPTPEDVWHYQKTPGDKWDYTSTQQMILADLKIDGAPRKVFMHAPKNGFFYVSTAATAN